MTSRPRQLLGRVASKWIGERAIPVGGVASDRRLLRRVLEGRSVGRVLVIGRSLAARQALAPMQIDVAGTSPYATEITVCSTVNGVDSLPRARWDTIIFTDAGRNLSRQLAAARQACRVGARLIILDCGLPMADEDVATTLTEVASIEELLVHRGRRLWLARVPA
jgi:hypothetical protein